MGTALKISPAISDADGALSHTVVSPYQAGETKIHVLLPREKSRGTDVRVLYVLPVEPQDGQQCGDPFAELHKLDVQNKHRLICVKPTFSHAPWYADHPSDPCIRQETHFLTVVVPF